MTHWVHEYVKQHKEERERMLESLALMRSGDMRITTNNRDTTPEAIAQTVASIERYDEAIAAYDADIAAGVFPD